MECKAFRFVSALLLAAVLAANAGTTGTPANADSTHATKLRGAAARIDSFLNTLTRKGQFQGTVLVTRSGKTLLKRGYGWADATSHRKNTAATQFSIGSITKQFTAAAILQLQERGKLSVDDPVCRYLSS